MVTMQSWMFLRSFAELRAISEEKLLDNRKRGVFTGLLREASIESLAHLGPNAFEEISGEVVQSAMMTFRNHTPTNNHEIVAFRIVGLKSAQEKAVILRSARLFGANQFRYIVLQAAILSLLETPIVYWLLPKLFALLQGSRRIYDIADVRAGLTTADSKRFTRCFWEVASLGTVNNARPVHGRWFQYVKGGGYCKWAGLEWLCCDWEHNGRRISSFPSSYLRSPELYFRSGLTYTLMAQGNFASRVTDKAIYGDTGSSIFVKDGTFQFGLMALTAVRIVSYLLRVTTQNLKFREGYVTNLTLPMYFPVDLLISIGKVCYLLKSYLITKDPTEYSFIGVTSESNLIKVQSILHSLEGLNERLVSDSYELDDQGIQALLEETGIPAGWYPLIQDYDTPSSLPTGLDLSSLPQELFDFLETHERIQPNGKELARIKANLRTLYEAGIGARNVEQEEKDELTEDNEGDEETTPGAHIPIPTETFLEELSVKMQLHPISVYWLLEELRAEGVRCKPEEQRLLEDRLSVLVLRLSGHRWPKQLEAGERAPDWADSDGIIPLVSVTGEVTLAEQVRARLRAQDGELGTQQTEALLAELMNLSLEEWLRKRFFPRHVSQFKYRPIAWHLVSMPVNNGKKRRGSSQRTPAFECLLYYHACSGDALARIRTQYVEPLLRAERQRMVDASLFQDETTSVLAHDRMQELVAFVEKLRFIEEQGFACPELDTIIAEEPLDRWSGDGYLPPTNRDELLHNEQAWHVDINDGVRVNIAPLQLAGVLASDVLKAVDAKKAIADRARWRADERRWVRDGKLPRCGWMHEQVPESPRWTEREPQRVAEQHKLEQKRLAIQHKHTEEVEL